MHVCPLSPLLWHSWAVVTTSSDGADAKDKTADLKMRWGRRRRLHFTGGARTEPKRPPLLTPSLFSSPASLKLSWLLFWEILIWQKSGVVAETRHKGSIKREKGECMGEEREGGVKKEAQCVHISLAWRFAEVCTPLEPAVSLANDTSGASLGNGVRRAPGFHISSTRYFGIRKRGRRGTSFQELMWLFLSCFLSPRQSAPLLSSFLLLLYFCTRRHSLSHSSFSLFLPSYLLSSFSLHTFWFADDLRWGGSCLFINLFIVCEIKSFYSLSPLRFLCFFSSWLRQMNV